MIIDAHAHIYPAKIAVKASEAIGDFYRAPMAYDGTAERLIAVGDAAGVDRFLVHSVATVPRQVRSINDYILGEVAARPDRFIGFATMHPDMEDAEGEFRRVMDAGLRGIKLHPDFQQFAINDPRMDVIYGLAEGVCPILFHTGDARYAWSDPDLVRPVLQKFPRLQVICAHFGGYSQWDKVRRAYDGLGVYVDTSSSFFALSPEKIRDLVAFFGTDRMLFGSDYPMWNAADEIQNVRSLGLPPNEEEAVFSGNLLRLLRL